MCPKLPPALRALALDSMLGGAHAALGDVHALYEWDWSASERRFQRAIALDPNNANTHHPLSPTISSTVGQSLNKADRLTEALAVLEGVQSLNPDFSITNSALGEVYWALGRQADAVRSFEVAVKHSGGFSIEVGFLGYVYAKTGRQGESRKLLQDLNARWNNGYVSPTSVALLLTGLGDTTQAFQWLGRAADERDPLLLYTFVTNRLLEGPRKDPRGLALLQRMNLPAGR